MKILKFFKNLKHRIKKKNHKFVHDEDLEGLLKSIGAYEKILNKQINCTYCGEPITLENLHIIKYKNSEFRFYCNNAECIQNL